MSSLKTFWAHWAPLKKKKTSFSSQQICSSRVHFLTDRPSNHVEGVWSGNWDFDLSKKPISLFEPTRTRNNEKSKPAMRKANQLFRYFLSKLFFFFCCFSWFICMMVMSTDHRHMWGTPGHYRVPQARANGNIGHVPCQVVSDATHRQACCIGARCR